MPVRIEVKTNHWPRLSAWHVRRALKWVSSADLTGLGFILLMDEEPDDPQSHNEAPYLRGFLYNGRYLKKSGEKSAHIALYTRDLYFGIPRLLLASPMATLIITSTLAHEIGHHLIATRGYIYKRNEKYKPWRSGTFDPYEEKMADGYAEDIVKRMCQSWYYKFGKLLARMTSCILFELGVREHWNGNYERAARWNFRAFMINPENLDAGQSYRHDMEKVLNSKHMSSVAVSNRLPIERPQRRHLPH